MSLDILAALEATPGGTKSGEACKIQRWLDTIPQDAPGRDALEAAFTELNESSDDYRTLDQLMALGVRLGFRTSIKTIGEHRRRMCRCFY